MWRLKFARLLSTSSSRHDRQKRDHRNTSRHPASTAGSPRTGSPLHRPFLISATSPPFVASWTAIERSDTLAGRSEFWHTVANLFHSPPPYQITSRTRCPQTRVNAEYGVASARVPTDNRERNLRESGRTTHRPGRDARDVIAVFNGETGKKSPNR